IYMELYKLDDKYIQLIQLMEETDEDNRVSLEDTLESIVASQEEKYEAIVYVMRNSQAKADAYKAEAEFFTKRKVVEENNVKRLKEYLRGSLIATKKDKASAGLFTVGVQNSKGSVEVLDDSLIPQKYKVPQPDAVDKKLIYADTKE